MLRKRKQQGEGDDPGDAEMGSTALMGVFYKKVIVAVPVCG